MAASKRKKKLRRDLLLPLSTVMFLICGLLYLGTSVFLKSYNNTLSAKKQSVETQIVSTKQENDEATKEIDQLSSQNRVAAVAQETMKYQAQNIISVTTGQ